MFKLQEHSDVTAPLRVLATDSNYQGAQALCLKVAGQVDLM